uniref:uncharacterized protein LOC120330674 isoform X1 n=1 Tax=Styela clava TaxID=7725 RepID=UPI0019392F9F|nr:uncharacterized protein LOC120330674 isoform X1 [Styela clava]
MKMISSLIFVILTFFISVTSASSLRNVFPAVALPADEFCPLSCKGSCYYQIKRIVPYEWSGANDECEKLQENGHLANIYNYECYTEIRAHLVQVRSRGEILIGMKFFKAANNPSNKINLFRSKKQITVPKWYRRRPNRIGQTEMTLLVGQNTKFSGMRNVLDESKHTQILCEIQKK